MVPSTVTQNWDLYNSFRSGDVGRPPNEWWDLRGEILEVCEDECGEGRIYVTARVNNAGNIDMPRGVPVSLRAGEGGDILATAITTALMPPGTTGEVFTFEVATADILGRPPVFTADEDSSGASVVDECDETNNADDWPTAACE